MVVRRKDFFEFVIVADAGTGKVCSFVCHNRIPPMKWMMKSLQESGKCDRMFNERCPEEMLSDRGRRTTPG
jgi:hypothetical protein